MIYLQHYTILHYEYMTVSAGVKLIVMDHRLHGSGPVSNMYATPAMAAAIAMYMNTIWFIRVFLCRGNCTRLLDSAVCTVRLASVGTCSSCGRSPVTPLS